MRSRAPETAGVPETDGATPGVLLVTVSSPKVWHPCPAIGRGYILLAAIAGPCQLAGWIGKVTALQEPLADAVGHHLLAGRTVLAGDSPEAAGVFRAMAVSRARAVHCRPRSSRSSARWTT